MTQEILYFDPKLHEAMFHLQRDPKFSKLMINPNKIINLNHLPSSGHNNPPKNKATKESKCNHSSTSQKNVSNYKAYEQCQQSSSTTNESCYLPPVNHSTSSRSFSDEYSNTSLRSMNFYRERNAHLEIVNGCRIYRIQNSDPHKTADIFVNYIPMNVFEQELVELFEQVGPIETLRLVMHDSLPDHSRGFCFITFVNKEHSHRAIQMFDNKEFHGKYLSVQHCITNSILYIKQIPRSLSQNELFDTFTRFAPNLINVILPQCNYNTSQRNRGFCFLHYSSYESAKNAKELFAQHRFQPWGSPLQVLWANPLNLAKTRTLFVRNIPSYADESSIVSLFSQCGRVERVIRKRDYVFVHFVKYEDALVAIDSFHGKPFYATDTQPEMRMIVTLARADRRSTKFTANTKNNHRQHDANFYPVHNEHRTLQTPQLAVSYSNPSPSGQNVIMSNNHSPVARVTVGVIDPSASVSEPGTSLSSSESTECCHCHGHSYIQYYPVINTIPSSSGVGGTWPSVQLYSDWCYLPHMNLEDSLLEPAYLDLI